MILGTGIDICEVARIEQSIARFGEQFLRRVFTEQEIRYCQSKKNSVERYAARFAAKEAAMKALGTGWAHGVVWKSVEVGREPRGRPTLLLHAKAAELAKEMGVTRVSLSLTHTETSAMAFVVLEG
ncbi:MAG: holo-ACP synthase [Acidobacteria bacterium]|nr:holo-ACP synthase [Acidobacteriota bacterium]